MEQSNNEETWFEQQKRLFPQANEEVLLFIKGFVEYEPDAIDEMHHLFMSGYCYYFAHILKTAFNRGDVVWVAPYGHLAWQDTDGTAYDFCGVNHDDCLYYIPEEFLGDAINDFKHIRGKEYNASTNDITKIIMEYEHAMGIPKSQSKAGEFCGSDLERLVQAQLGEER